MKAEDGEGASFRKETGRQGGLRFDRFIRLAYTNGFGSHTPIGSSISPLAVLVPLPVGWQIRQTRRVRTWVLSEVATVYMHLTWLICRHTLHRYVASWVVGWRHILQGVGSYSG